MNVSFRETKSSTVLWNCGLSDSEHLRLCRDFYILAGFFSSLFDTGAF